MVLQKQVILVVTWGFSLVMWSGRTTPTISILSFGLDLSSIREWSSKPAKQTLGGTPGVEIPTPKLDSIFQIVSTSKYQTFVKYKEQVGKR